MELGPQALPAADQPVDRLLRLEADARARERHEVKPGGDATVQIDLLVSVACEVGVRFTVRENNEIVGEGVVTELLD